MRRCETGYAGKEVGRKEGRVEIAIEKSKIG